MLVYRKTFKMHEVRILIFSFCGLSYRTTTEIGVKELKVKTEQQGLSANP